jgi:ammonia channel protein AmtB
VVILLGVIGSLFVLKICDVALGARASSEREIKGLGFSMHGEKAYNLEA